MSVSITINRRWQRAIAAIMGHATLTGAADACGLHVRTLRRYLANPAFRMALSDAEQEQIEGAARALMAGQPQALRTLSDLMKNARSESNKRLAATSWIELGLKFREIATIEERLLALEDKVLYGQHR